MDIAGSTIHKQSASRLTVIAHLCGILAIILMLVWLLHYRGGIEYHSDNPDRVFNAHPFFMFCGLIFLVGEAMMTYKTISSAMIIQKSIHMFLHLIALCLGIVGLCAVFRFHDMIQAEDVYSLHSWVGLSTFCLFCLQWEFGFFAFVFPKAGKQARASMLPWHVCGGRALLYMATCAALTGLIEKATFLELKHHRESRLINFTGLFILLFGIFVDLSVALARYWLLGIFSFVFPGAEMSARDSYRPWHVFGGSAIFFLAISAAQTGLLETSNLLGLGLSQDGLIVKFTGLLLFLIAVGVGPSSVLPRGHY